MPLVLRNIGFVLLTGTLSRCGGWDVFGWAFRPVTVEAGVLAADDGRTIWHDSNERILGGKILKTYPESEQSKKETQLEASLREAISEMAKSLSE